MVYFLYINEIENCNTLPFTGILLINNKNKLEFKIYHESTSKNDHIHFYLHNKNEIKRGEIIGFYIKAIRISTQKYLNDIFDYIKNPSSNFIIRNLM